MEQARDHTHLGVGYYDPGKNVVELGTAFRTGDEPKDRANRAGMILHEASHSIIGSKDIFNEHGEPTSQGKPTNPGDKVGCMLSYFLRRATGSHLLFS